MAGLFFAWSFSVMPGLAILADRDFVTSMQAMNIAIQNPLFLTIFMGTGVLLPVSAYLHFHQPVSMRCWLLMSAAAVYLIGVIAVTFIGNIPLNNALGAVNLSAASQQEITNARLIFERPWNILNAIRTLCSSLALICTILACISRGR
jgi:uncharacterized membrane protein